MTAKHARFFKYTLQCDNDNENAGAVTVQIPGPTEDSLNRRGFVAIWHVMRWFVRGINFAIRTTDPKTGRSFVDMHKVAHKMLFMRAVNMTIEEDLHKLLDADQEPSFSVEIRLSDVGNTSWNTFSILRDENSGKVLATHLTKFVSMSEETRKPIPLPEWWKRKYASSVVESQELVVPSLVVPTENTYKHVMKVAWNDTDRNNHATNTSYPIFCFEAAMEAIRNNVYFGFHGDILSYKVKTLQMSFVKDARAGDPLTVITWQDAHHPNILHFSIERADEIIYQNSMEFFLRSYL